MAGFKSFLSAFGHDFVKVFNWLGSTQGQSTINAVEGGVNVVVGVVASPLEPALVGIEGLINAGIRKIFDIEASTAAVGSQSGTGAQKSAVVVATIAPQVESLLLALGIKEPTAAQIQEVATAISTGLVSVLNAIPAPPAATPAP